MTELFWPGNARAGDVFTADAFVAAMIRVEQAWLTVLHEAGVAPPAQRLPDVAVAEIASGAESGGNPVIPLVAALRAGADEPTRSWVHRGLTSQDVLDTALMLCTRDTADQVLADVERATVALQRHSETHRRSLQAARTLTQHAVPTTFGLVAANWLIGLLDAAEDLVAARDRLPVQLGGAGGTQAAIVALGADPSALMAALAARLELAPSPPWQTSRRPVTRVGDALLAIVDALGRIANDVLVRARAEVGELSEPAPGGSSTMPHKQNPVLSVLIKRAALAAPFVAGQLHAAAAAVVDERPDGAWHVEWAALRALGRTAAIAASQAADLLDGLVVHTEQMLRTAENATTELLAEQRAITGGTSGSIADYLGATDTLIDQALHRADAFRKGGTR